MTTASVDSLSKECLHLQEHVRRLENTLVTIKTMLELTTRHPLRKKLMIQTIERSLKDVP